MTRKPTRRQRWALLLVLQTSKELRRAPESHEVCAHHRLSPKRATQFRCALRGLIAKGVFEPWPVPKRPLRIADAARSIASRL